MDVRNFWLSTLQCGPWVANVLENGYTIPFKKLPGQYDERNNASVINNMEIVSDMVMTLKKQGVIEFVDEKPWCVSPLGLVSKKVDGVVKHRLVFDASRWINLHVDPPSVKLAHLEKALSITKPGDYQVVFDITSAYYNIKIHPDQVKYLGASITIEGRTQYFTFCYLPFGLNSAVFAVTKLWKPITAYIHKNGIRFSIYIDDGRILAEDAIQAERHRQFVYDVVTKAGWIMSIEKSDGQNEASQVKNYLGFTIDSLNMTVSYSADKLAEFCDKVVTALGRHEIHVKELSSILGKMISLGPSHGMSVRICSRAGYAMMESHVERYGWAGTVPWSTSAKEELLFFVQHASEFNHSMIINALTDIRVDTVISNPLSSQDTIRATKVDTVLVSDSSAIKAAVTMLQGQGPKWSAIFTFSNKERGLSSGERELLAVHKMLKASLNDHKFNQAHIFWGTDSTNLVAFLTKGSPKQWIQKRIFEVLQMTAALKCIITPVHLFRDDVRIQGVDYLSKEPDADNWSIDQHSFESFDNDFHFDLDVFADENNKKVKNFYSKYYHEDSQAVDAFSVEWPGMLWLCPPVALILRVVRRIKASKCQGLLIIPNWPAADYYCEVFAKENVLAPFQFISEFKPYIFQNEHATNTPLFGIPQFTFFALYFNTL